MATNQQVIQDIKRVIGLIRTDIHDLSQEEKNQMVQDTIEHFNHYVSPGWLKYRKSVSSDSDSGAVLEWQDEGSYCYGLNGEKFIDCLGGFGIYTCGHRNPEILDVVKAQLDHQALHSQELLDPLRGYLAKAMADITPGDLQYCFFTNGGAEAVEMALKLARIATGGRWVISTVGAFHGKTMGAVSMGGKGTYRTPYLPMIQQVQHVEYGVAEDVEKAIRNLQAVGEKVAAVILEPIQGEAGIIVPPKGYLQRVREICDETGVALIFDEIQCGMGRTGHYFAWQAYGVQPDIMTSAKALGCGVPVGAFVLNEKAAKASLEPGDHGTTYGGNPFVCAAVSKVFDIYENDKIIEHVQEMTPYLEQKLDEIVAKHECAATRRGMGFMQGIVIQGRPVGEVVKAALAKGLLVISAGSDVLRIVPPLVITKEHIDKMAAILDECME